MTTREARLRVADWQGSDSSDGQAGYTPAGPMKATGSDIITPERVSDNANNSGITALTVHDSDTIGRPYVVDVIADRTVTGPVPFCKALVDIPSGTGAYDVSQSDDMKQPGRSEGKGFGIRGITVSSAGRGYRVAPGVTVAGSGTAVATINDEGGVESIEVTSRGGVQSSAPTITIDTPQVRATATATIDSGQITGFTITNPGAGYQNAPAVTIAAPSTGTTATATAEINSVGQVTGLTITNEGTGYTTAPTVTIANAVATRAVASITYSGVSNGRRGLAALAVNTAGGYYVVPPPIVFAASDTDGDTVLPTARAILGNNGQVASFEVLTPGNIISTATLTVTVQTPSSRATATSSIALATLTAHFEGASATDNADVDVRINIADPWAIAPHHATGIGYILFPNEVVGNADSSGDVTITGIPWSEVHGSPYRIGIYSASGDTGVLWREIIVEINQASVDLATLL